MENIESALAEGNISLIWCDISIGMLEKSRVGKMNVEVDTVSQYLFDKMFGHRTVALGLEPWFPM